MISLD